MEWIDEEIIKEKGEFYFKFLKLPSFLFWIFFIILFIYGIYFLKIAVFEHKRWILAAEGNQILEVTLPAPRGLILDRNKKILCENEASFDLIADLNKLSESTLNEIENIISIYNLDYEISGNNLYVKNLPKEIALKFLIKFPNFLELMVLNTFQRKCNFQEEFSNLIGYLGLPDKEEVAKYKVKEHEYIGKMGIEKSYNRFLRGTNGTIKFVKDAKLNIVKISEKKEPIIGNYLVLTIDYDFQKKAYEAMKRYMKENGYKKGGLIAMNPNTGEILAMISYPSFDINIFTKERKKLEEVLENPFNPLFNRIISGLYSPGSVIKPLIAIGALEEKIIDPNKKIYSSGELRIPNPYFPGTYSVFRDWKVHGWVNMKEAIANSVNIYFYTIGGGYGDQQGLGIYRIKKYLELFGLGRKTGIDLIGEKDGFIPTPETKKQNKIDPNWRLGDTYNISIGQGDILVTPLQIAVFTSALATNKLVRPYLVKEIVDYKGQIIFKNHPKIIKENLVNSENLKIVQEGMRMTVTQGTAKILADLPIAGKSGTPEIFGKKKLNAFFTGYAPYEKPEIVLVVFIEEVPIGSVATLPLYREIMEIYFSKNHSLKPELHNSSF